jgi:hypothetical protein
MAKITDKYSNYLIIKVQAEIQLSSLKYDLSVMGENKLRMLYSALEGGYSGLRELIEEALQKRQSTII